MGVMSHGALKKGLTKVLSRSLLPLSSNLDLFEEFTLSQDVVCHGTY